MNTSLPRTQIQQLLPSCYILFLSTRIIWKHVPDMLALYLWRLQPVSPENTDILPLRHDTITVPKKISENFPVSFNQALCKFLYF